MRSAFIQSFVLHEITKKGMDSEIQTTSPEMLTTELIQVETGVKIILGPYTKAFYHVLLIFRIRGAGGQNPFDDAFAPPSDSTLSFL